MSQSKLSVAFLLGSPDISGGTYVIFEHATHLISFGHQVTIVTEEQILPHRLEWHPRAADLDWLTIGDAQTVRFDIVIATWWKSPFLLNKLNGSHYVYFVQSIESRFFQDEDPTHHDERDLNSWKEYCESTYSCNIPVITEARWIQEYLYDNYNRDSFLVRNGIRKDFYREDGETITPRDSNRLRVLIEGPVDVGFKNVPKSIELCKKAEIDEIWLLTSSDIKEFPNVDRVFSKVPIQETPAIFRSCDVLVKLSYIEGMFGPPLEMFHCGGTAIVYDVTGHDEYIIHDQNSFVAARDDEKEVVRLLKILKNTPGELQRLKMGARQSAAKWIDWKGAALEFERALREITLQQPTNQQYLNSWIGKMEAEKTVRVTSREIGRFQKREQDKNTSPDLDNFIQVYCWAEKDGLENGLFKWAHYPSGKQFETSVEVEITGFPFWVRIDPSVRIGILEIFSISIRNTTTGNVVYDCRQPEQFHQLYVAGTMKNIGVPDRALFLSFGDDPQLILPAITSGEKGDTISITIQLHEMGMSECIRMNSVKSSHEKIVTSPRQLLKRFLSKILQ